MFYYKLCSRTICIWIPIDSNEIKVKSIATTHQDLRDNRCSGCIVSAKEWCVVLWQCDEVTQPSDVSCSSLTDSTVLVPRPSSYPISPAVSQDCSVIERQHCWWFKGEAEVRRRNHQNYVQQNWVFNFFWLLQIKCREAIKGKWRFYLFFPAWA